MTGWIQSLSAEEFAAVALGAGVATTLVLRVVMGFVVLGLVALVGDDEETR